MKKNKLILMLTAVGSMLSLASCGGTASNNKDAFDTSKQITRYTRNTDSGTRDGFFTAIGYSDAIQDNEKIPGSVKVESNGQMITYIKNDKFGLGYISLASLESSGLNAVNYNGVVPTEDNVVNGTYKLSRNFNYVHTVDFADETEENIVKAFILFTKSKEGFASIKSKDGILTSSLNDAKTFQSLLDLDENAALKAACAQTGDKYDIKFGGSTSVESVSKALTSAFSKVCKRFNPIHNHTGSSNAFKCTQGSEKDGANKLHVGFLSRELKSSEATAENTSGLLCKDGIVVVTNHENDTVKSLTAEQLKKIYEEENSVWKDYIK